jgi:hypothetical protein
MWIIPSELTDALRGIGGALGATDKGTGPDGGGEDEWVDPGMLKDAFDDTVLEDPAQALAEARGMAGRASQEATEHAAPVQRVQPPIGRPADAVPEPELFDAPETGPVPPAAPAPDAPQPTAPVAPTEEPTAPVPPPPVTPEDGPRSPGA